MNPYKFDQNSDSLFRAILSLKTTAEAEKFFRDLCTVKELKDFSDRWQIVRLLEKGLTYRDIADVTKTSTTTVSRVASWRRNGEGGYGLALKRLGLLSSGHHNPNSKGRGLN